MGDNSTLVSSVFVCLRLNELKMMNKDGIESKMREKKTTNEVLSLSECFIFGWV